MRHSSYILVKLELSPQMFEKYSDIKFHGNPFSGAELFVVVTDRRVKVNSRACSRFVDAFKN
jgi:hypothetical protein